MLAYRDPMSRRGPGRIDEVVRAVWAKFQQLSQDQELVAGVLEIANGSESEESREVVLQNERRDGPHVFEDAAEFVGDVTIPDGTVIFRGATFTKTWEIRNVGTVPWVGRRLVRVTPHSHTFPRSAAFVEVRDTEPGASVQISVEMTASDIDGATEVRFKMADARGVLSFGERYSYGLGVTIVTKAAGG